MASKQTEQETTPRRYTPIKLKCDEFLKSVKGRDQSEIRQSCGNRISSSICNVSGIKQPMSPENQKCGSSLSSNDRMSQVDENIECEIDTRILE